MNSVTRNTYERYRCRMELFDTKHVMVGIQTVGDTSHHTETESNSKDRLGQMNNIVSETTHVVEEMMVETVGSVVNELSKLVEESTGRTGEKETPLVTEVPAEIVSVKLVDVEEHETHTNEDMEMEFSEDNTPIVKGSALCALEDTKPELGVEAINQLMEVVDQTIPTPERDLDVPFLMPVDHVHNIQGRGCVITGRLERGKLKVGLEV